MSTVSPEQSNPYAPPKAEVADPNSTAEFQLASLVARLGAWALDLVGSILCVVPILVGLGLSVFTTAATDPAALVKGISGAGAAATGIASLVWLGLNIYFVVSNAQTVGKRIVGIKVARPDGSRAGFARIFWLRNFVNGLPSAIPVIGNFYFFVDSLFIVGDGRRCLHDRIANTIVINA